MPIAVSLNGKIVPPDEARVSVFDRGFLYGDSVYETIRTHGGRPFKLREHLARLERSAARLGLELPGDLDELGEEVARTVAAVGSSECSLRMMVTRGEGPIGLDTRSCGRPTSVIIARPLEPLPAELYETGVRVVKARTVRNSAQALDPSVKSGNFLNNILGMREAQAAGAFDAVMLNADGEVAEATTSNIFLVLDGKLVTPSAAAGILCGITRDLVLELCRRSNIDVEERVVEGRELGEAEELFLTSSLKNVLPVTGLGDAKVGDGVPGPHTRRVMRLMEAEIERFVASS